MHGGYNKFRVRVYGALLSIVLGGLFLPIFTNATNAAWYWQHPTWVDDDTITVLDTDETITFSYNPCNTTEGTDNCRLLANAGRNLIEANTDNGLLAPSIIPFTDFSPDKYKLFTTSAPHTSIPIANNSVNYPSEYGAAVGIVYAWDKPGKLYLVSIIDNPNGTQALAGFTKIFTAKEVIPTNTSYQPAKPTFLPAGSKVSGLVEIVTRGDAIVNPDIVKKKLKIFITQPGGGRVDLDDGWTDEDAAKVESTAVDKQYKYTMTIKQPIMAPGDYTLQTQTAKDGNVDCITGEDNGAKANLTGEWCTLSYSGSSQFSLDKDGKIQVAAGSTKFEKKSTGRNITSVSNPNSGLNLTVNEALDSPLDKAISNAIKWIVGFVEKSMNFVMGGINSLLDETEDYVLGTKAEMESGDSAMMRPWTSIRNIALGLLVMALIIIAFANVFQVDIEQYGLNRIIPRIIISIIMAYASWIIVTFFFDMSSAIQATAKGLSSTNMLESLKGMTLETPNSGQIVANLGILLTVIVILIGIIACGLVLMFTLLIRIVMLSFLLVIAPLAFILNIVPFTANLYKQWWNEFFKWMFMGPMAMAIIALGSTIASASALGGKNVDLMNTSAADLTTFGGGRMNTFIGLIIFAASLYMAATLPMKWGGSVMKSWGGVGKKLWGATGGNVQKGAGWLGGKAWGATGVPGGTSMIRDRVGDWFGRGREKRENAFARAITGDRVGMNKDVVAMRQKAAILDRITKQEGIDKLNDRGKADLYASAKNPYVKEALIHAAASTGDIEKLFTDPDNLDAAGGWKSGTDRALDDAQLAAARHMISLGGRDKDLEDMVITQQPEIAMLAGQLSPGAGSYGKGFAGRGFASQRLESYKKRSNAFTTLDFRDKAAQKFMTTEDVRKDMTAKETTQKTKDKLANMFKFEMAADGTPMMSGGQLVRADNKTARNWGRAGAAAGSADAEAFAYYGGLMQEYVNNGGDVHADIQGHFGVTPPPPPTTP